MGQWKSGTSQPTLVTSLVLLLKHLPLPASVRDEVTLKLCMGIPTERILEGKHMIN